MSDLVLSTFPGIGLLCRGFEANGFAVVRGPDTLWGGDVRKFHPPSDVFVGVIGGPPCQSHSWQGKSALARGQEVAEDLIPEFARVVEEAAPLWFVMENVTGAPPPTTPSYDVEDLVIENRHCLDDAGVGGVQRRKRRISIGARNPTIDPVPWRWGKDADRPRERVFRWELAGAIENATFVSPYIAGTVTASGSEWRNGRAEGVHSRAKLREMCRLQGLGEDFADAISPPFKLREAIRAVGNGVPFPMAFAIGRAIRRATAEPEVIE